MPKQVKKSEIISNVCSSMFIYATSLGVSTKELFTDTKVNLSDLMSSDELVDTHFVLQLLSKIDKACDNSNSSLKIASILPLSIGGVVSNLVYHAEDIKTMLELFVRADPLITDQANTQIIYTENELILNMQHELDAVSNGLLPEFAMAFVYKVIKHHFGSEPLPITAVTFTHSKRGPLLKYENYFNVPIEFDARYNALIFDRKLLSLPNIKEEIIATSILIQQIDELRKKKGFPDFDKLSQINKTVKLNCLVGDFSVDGLANELAMSPRNLQRHLKTKGTSAKTLIDETRYKLSLKLLTDKRNSIAQITEKLGYSSERGFREAFKKWSGEYPAQIRKEIENN